MSSVTVYGTGGQPVGRISSRRRPNGPRLRSAIRITPMPLRRYYLDARGLHRIFDTACYRFYRSASGPPAAGDTPFATSPTLPATPADTFADGTWYLAVSWFNGVLDSGFIPVGPAGETYIKMVVSAGAAITEPPADPLDWHLTQTAGVVRVSGIYHDADDRKADEWAMAYSTDGSDPTADDPSITVDVPVFGPGFLTYDLPAQSHETVVKVILQTRRNDGTVGSPDWRYSGSEIKSITVDALGPAAPEGGAAWPGRAGLT